MQQLKEMSHFRQKFLNGQIDLYKTHIKEFENLVDLHLRHVFQSIFKQKYTDRKKRLIILSEFVHEAQAAKKEKRITYEWWLQFNYRLSILLTPEDLRTIEQDSFNNLYVKTVYESGAWLSEKLFAPFLKLEFEFNSRFSDNLILNGIREFERLSLIPTHFGEVDIRVINRATAEGIQFLGLIADVQVNDGKEMYPDKFFRHDELHFKNSVYVLYGNLAESNNFKSKKAHFFNKLDKLSPEVQRSVHLIYFLTYENQFIISEVFNIKDGAVVRKRLQRWLIESGKIAEVSSFRELIERESETFNFEDQVKYLNQGIENFIEILLSI